MAETEVHQQNNVLVARLLHVLTAAEWELVMERDGEKGDRKRIIKEVCMYVCPAMFVCMCVYIIYIYIYIYIYSLC